MLSTPNISCCLLLFAASSVRADPYRGREKVGSDGEFDVRGSYRGLNVEEFDVTDNRRPNIDDFDIGFSRSVEGFDGIDTVSVENFGTPTPTEEGTKRRTVGSWSSWSRKPNGNFPNRNRKKIETPRSRRRDPMTRPDHSEVERIVVFPCQDEKLR